MCSFTTTANGARRCTRHAKFSNQGMLPTKWNLLLVREDFEQRLLRIGQRVGGIGVGGRRCGGRNRWRRAVRRLAQRRGIKLTRGRVSAGRMRHVLGPSLTLALSLSLRFRRAAECLEKRLLRIRHRVCVIMRWRRRRDSRRRLRNVWRPSRRRRVALLTGSRGIILLRDWRVALLRGRRCVDLLSRRRRISRLTLRRRVRLLRGRVGARRARRVSLRRRRRRGPRILCRRILRRRIAEHLQEADVRLPERPDRALFGRRRLRRRRITLLPRRPRVGGLAGRSRLIIWRRGGRGLIGGRIGGGGPRR
jgi:hypothetical protein